MANKKSSKIQDSIDSGKKSEPKKKKNTISVSEIVSSIVHGYGEESSESTRKVANEKIKGFLQQIFSNSDIKEKYNLLILFDNSRLVKSDADNIYNAITKFDNGKPINLVLHSRGGSAASAYLIGKLCREYSNNNFIVTVPRYAKSAATMICCGAREIHMGSLSELGPIDPQINDLPALGLKNSIQHIAELVKIYPESSNMFARYLHFSLDLINLGYYERVAESAMQYANNLLATNESLLPKSASDLAYHLVYNFKDHSFVIDWQEAENIFGNKIVKKDTSEYILGNELYNKLSLVDQVASIMKHNFYFIGSLNSDPNFTKWKNK